MTIQRRPLLPLRDIRSDLQRRLKEAVARAEEHAALAANARNEADLLTQLLDQENRRFGGTEKAHALERPEKPLADFIVAETMKGRPLSKDDFRNRAEQAGYFPVGKGDARSIHATVINLVKANRLREISEGLYAVPA